MRNLNLPKWKKLEDGLLTAQILSTDLRCDKTGMSFWRCQDPKDETALHEVALALAAGRRHLEAISLVWLPAEQLCEAGFAWQYSSGATLVADLKDNHVDVEVLDTNRFVRLAELLQESVQDGKHCKINANRLRKLLLTAIQADRLPVSKLDPPLLTKLLGRLEGEFRRQAEQVYLDSGLNCRLDSFQKAADWYLNNDEKGQLGDLKRQVENRLKESNRPEAAPDGVDLLRAVQERGQAPSTIFAVLADSMEGGESAPSP